MNLRALLRKLFGSRPGMRHRLRIQSQGPSTHGSRIFLDDFEVHGVTKVVLTAERDDLWRLDLSVITDGTFVDVENFAYTGEPGPDAHPSPEFKA